MKNHEISLQNFCVVRDRLKAEIHGDYSGTIARAYRLAFKQPFKFYRENTIDNAIEILKAKATE